MVLRRLFPPGSGGPFRRFLTLRQNLYRSAYNDDRPLRGPISLFDLRNDDDATDLRNSIDAARRGLFAGWRVSDDSVIGGGSTSRIRFVTPDDDASSAPYLRWSGNIDTAVDRSNPKSRHVTRSGFAALMTPEFPFGAPLGERYKALEICCRTDGRTYAVNLHVETYFPEDMYQGFIGREGLVVDDDDADTAADTPATIRRQQQQPTMDDDETNRQQQPFESSPPPPNQSLDVRQYIRHRYKRLYQIDPSTDPISGFPPANFTRLILPFADFTLTSKGRARMEQRTLDGAISIESIGFTLMDGRDGPFTFDLVSVRGVNVLEGEVVGTLEDERREEEMRRLFLEEAGKKE